MQIEYGVNATPLESSVLGAHQQAPAATVGQNEWADTSRVADKVQIKFKFCNDWRRLALSHRSLLFHLSNPSIGSYPMRQILTAAAFAVNGAWVGASTSRA